MVLRACPSSPCEWLLHLPSSPVVSCPCSQPSVQGRARHVAPTDVVLFKETRARPTWHLSIASVCHSICMCTGSITLCVLAPAFDFVPTASGRDQSQEGVREASGLLMAGSSLIGCRLFEAGEGRLFLAQPRRSISLIGHYVCGDTRAGA